jgi:SAM-dependent MidA family methyltransferase
MSPFFVFIPRNEMSLRKKLTKSAKLRLVEISSNISKSDKNGMKDEKNSTNWISSLHKTFASENQVWKFANNFYRKVR